MDGKIRGRASRCDRPPRPARAAAHPGCMNERLIIFAHGSSRASWKRPIEALAGRIGARLGAGRAQAAYLELCPPSLMDAAEQAVADGVGRLRVLPLFWSGGGHVTRDIPPQVAAVQARFPGLQITVESAVGEHPALVDALVAIAGTPSEA